LKFSNYRAELIGTEKDAKFVPKINLTD